MIHPSLQLMQITIAVFVAAFGIALAVMFANDMTKRDRAERLKKEQLAAQSLEDPDGATDEQRAAFWELEARKLSKTDVETRAYFAKALHCPATWKYIRTAFERSRA